MDIIGINKQLIGKSNHILSNEIFNNTLNIEYFELFIDIKNKIKNKKWFEYLNMINNNYGIKNEKEQKFMLEFALNMLQSFHIHFSCENKNNNNKKIDYIPLLCSMILITNKLKGIEECKELCKRVSCSL